MAKYSWLKDGDSYTVIHTEDNVTTLIALTDEAEKADFITKACEMFSEEMQDDEEK